MLQKMLLVALLAGVPLVVIGTVAGCDGGDGAKQGAASKADDHDHDHDHGADDHDHDHDHAAEASESGHVPGHGGTVVALGEQAIGSFMAVATRDAGEIAAGKEAPIDVTVTPGAEGGARVSAVRFWIGTEDAKGSVKARASIEDPNSPSRWHTHVEIPSPVPAGSRLWVEIEDDKGVTSVGSFELGA